MWYTLYYYIVAIRQEFEEKMSRKIRGRRQTEGSHLVVRTGEKLPWEERGEVKALTEINSKKRSDETSDLYYEAFGELPFTVTEPGRTSAALSKMVLGFRHHVPFTAIHGAITEEVQVSKQHISYPSAPDRHVIHRHSPAIAPPQSALRSGSLAPVRASLPRAGHRP